MTVETLRVAIAERAHELLIPRLMAAGVTHHKKGWRDCPCAWCDKKREATVVIGSHVPHFIRGHYVEDIRHIWREDKRREYRKAMAALEQEI